MPLDLPKNPFGNFCYGQTSVYRRQPTALGVIFRHRTRLVLILLQTLPNYFLSIVVADDQLGTVFIADINRFGRLKVDIEDMPVSLTGPAPSEPKQ